MRLRGEDASNIDAHTDGLERAGERATYEDPSELDMETRLDEHTSCERWKDVVAGPERLRRAPLPPSTPARPRPATVFIITHLHQSITSYIAIITHKFGKPIANRILQLRSYIYYPLVICYSSTETQF